MKAQIIGGDEALQEQFVNLVKNNMPQVEVVVADEKELIADNLKKKQRFVVRLGDKLYLVWMKEIAYFISREKTTYLVTNEAKQYIVDMSLDVLEKVLDSENFFRINRATIVNIHSIKMATRHFSSRLKLQLEPQLSDEEIFVSRVRTNDFMHWIAQ
ncbi:MAG: LytTR family transcriptional regulator DNA-binding domain-containing protein [Paludibacteraceae bacterium]|nr:LytTR family transcriptional regulator DNA-binding domain-containing protein [Paludibacteraceae bacterium]